jgi:hypothetical protein
MQQLITVSDIRTREAASCSCSEEPVFPVAENLCRVVGNEWVNPEYKHLVLDALLLRSPRSRASSSIWRARLQTIRQPSCVAR